MTRTFNRQPLSFNTPDSDDIKNYFQNNVNWKGKITNKNFLQVDQESFEDCNNVYVDDKQILRSRPSLKKYIPIGNNILENSLSAIVDCWTFNNIIVYQSLFNNFYYLTFCNDKFDISQQLKLSNNDSTFNDVRLVMADRKIFIFTKYYLKYYDIDDNNIFDGDDFIYIPNVKVTSNNIEDSTKKVDSENLLTNKKIYTYLYDNYSNVDYTKFIDKDLTLKIDDSEYQIHFTQDMENIFVKRYIDITDKNYSDEYIYGNNGDNIPLVEVANNGTLLLNILNKETKNNIVNHSYESYYTFDGIVMNKLSLPENIICPPKITNDGSYIIIFKNDGPYALSIVKTQENSYKYSTWTALCKDLGLDLGNINDTTPLRPYRKNIALNSVFFDDTDFVFIYGSNTLNDSREIGSSIGYEYQTLNYVICNKGTSTKGIIFDNTTIAEMYNYPDNTKEYQYKEICTLPYLPLITLNYYQNKFQVGVEFIGTCKNEENTLLVGRLFYTLIGQTNDNTLLSNMFLFSELETYTKHIEYRPCIKDCFNIYQNVEPSTILTTNQFAEFVSTSKRNDFYNNIKDDEIITLYTTVMTSKTPVLKSLLYKFENNINDKNIVIKTNISTNENNLQKVSYICNECYIKKYNDYIKLLFISEPIVLLGTLNNPQIFLLNNNTLYSNIQTFNIEIQELINGENNYILFDHIAKLDNFYISIKNKTYISSPTGESFKWYFPKINEQIFDYDVTNLHPISSSEVGIFLEDSVYYVRYDNYNDNTKAYFYVKSKLQVGCKNGSDVITTFDSKYVIFESKRGLVAMTYEQFVASTDQTLTYLSDMIYEDFYNYCKNGFIKLFKFSNWIFIYKQNDKSGYLLDTRTVTWWPMSITGNVNKIININNEVKILSNKSIYSLDKSDTNYYDIDNLQIKWFMTSQKLYLSAINYYKHIVNITFNSVHSIEELQNSNLNVQELNMNLKVINYRKTIDNKNTPVIINYIVNNAKTYVQRLNYGKVNEFQYTLSNDENSYFNVPLSLSGLTIKYKIGGQIR